MEISRPSHVHVLNSITTPAHGFPVRFPSWLANALAHPLRMKATPPPPPLQRGPLCNCGRTSFHFLFRGPSQVFSWLIFTPSASISEKGALKPDQLGDPVIKLVGGGRSSKRGPFVAPKLLFNTGNVVQPKGTVSTAIGGPNYCSLTPG